MIESQENAATLDKASPTVCVRTAVYHTFIYKKMVGQASPDAKPGDVVTVTDKNGIRLGHAFYNPRSSITLRMLQFGDRPFDDAFWKETILRAVALRIGVLNLDRHTDAYRLVHSEGDGISGLVVDKYGDCLSIEVFSLGIWRQIERLLPLLHEAAGTKHHLVRIDSRVQEQEGFKADPIQSEGMPKAIEIRENDLRFQIQFEPGHKTGFFCDQRDNRQRLAALTRGRDVLDLCSYTGAFGLYAMKQGGAKSVTCVDLDERPIEQAQKNANLNQARMKTVHSDAFIYMRQMGENQRLFDVVVLDPPKLVFGKNDTGQGRFKYADLNRLAAGLVRPGGILLTCSCSGALPADEFTKLVISSTQRAGREPQLLGTNGPGMDHPVSPRCAESSYLKAVWLRLM